MMTKVGIIGVGKLGLPCAQLMAEYYDVEGFDLLAKQPKNFLMVDSLSSLCADKNFIFIAVPTPHDSAYGGEAPSIHLPPRDFDYSLVKKILRELNEHTTLDQIVVLISTVLPGTTRREFAPLARNYHFIYNPYLISMGNVENDMAKPEMVIIGTEHGSETSDARRLVEFYAPILQNKPRIVVGTWDEAESIKIFYNTFISAKLSLVNMIQDVAERVGNIDADVVTDALRNSTQRIMGPAYMTPGMGDGGSCHPRDNIALRWLAQEHHLGYDLFEAIMASRERQAANLAEFLMKVARRHGLHQIWIHGEAFKPKVPFTDGSYSLLVAHFLRASGWFAHFVDPLTRDKLESVCGVVLLAHNAEITYSGASGCSSREFYCRFEPGSVIVDPWRRIRPEDVPGCSLILYGNTRLRDRDARVLSEQV